MFWRERERAKLSIETLLLVFAAQSLTSENEGVFFFVPKQRIDPTTNNC